MPKRVDDNQNELVNTFRQMGCSVLILSDVGKGCPDILVGLTSRGGGRVNLLVEIKDGSKPRSACKLTKDEQKFHEEWRGQVCIIYTVAHAVDLVNRVRG